MDFPEDPGRTAFRRSILFLSAALGFFCSLTIRLLFHVPDCSRCLFAVFLRPHSSPPLAITSNSRTFPNFPARIVCPMRPFIHMCTLGCRFLTMLRIIVHWTSFAATSLLSVLSPTRHQKLKGGSYQSISTRRRSTLLCLVAGLGDCVVCV